MSFVRSRIMEVDTSGECFMETTCNVLISGFV